MQVNGDLLGQHSSLESKELGKRWRREDLTNAFGVVQTEYRICNLINQDLSPGFNIYLLCYHDHEIYLI